MRDDGMIPAILTLPTLLCKYFNACGRYPGPVEFLSPMDNVTAIRGEDVTFICDIKHLGRHRVAWVKTDPKMKLLAYQHSIFRNKHKYRVHSQNDQENWILTIRNVQAPDRGGYMCQVNTNPMIAQIAYLNLKMPPIINRFASSEDTTVREGDNVTLTCVAEGTPEPMLSWRRTDMDVITLIPNQGGSSVVRGGQLSIQKVSRKHMAEYLCVAMNGIEPDSVYHIKLHVKFPPTVMPFVNQFVSASVGGSAELKCRVESWPRPDNIQWKFKGALITADSNKYPMQKIAEECKTMRSSSACPTSVGLLQIKNIKPSDFGTYVCEAENDEGVQTTTLVLQEDEASKIGRYNVVPENDFEGDDLKNEIPVSDDSGIDNNVFRSQTGDSSPNAVPNTVKGSNGAYTMLSRTHCELIFIFVMLTRVFCHL